jgi:hypothetical protein
VVYLNSLCDAFYRLGFFTSIINLITLSLSREVQQGTLSLLGSAEMDMSKNANFVIHIACDLAEYLLHPVFLQRTWHPAWILVLFKKNIIL